MSMPNWITLARFKRRELESLVKRGPTPFEVAMLKVSEKNRREREARARATQAEVV